LQFDIGVGVHQSLHIGIDRNKFNSLNLSGRNHRIDGIVAATTNAQDFYLGKGVVSGLTRPTLW